MSDERTNELLEAILERLSRIERSAQSPSAPAPAMEPSITIAEAQRILGCSRRKVFDLLRDGTLRRARRIGKTTMLLTSSVEAARRMPDLASAPKRCARRISVEEVGENFGDRIRALK